MSFFNKLKGKNGLIILFLVLAIIFFAYLFATSISGFSESLNPYSNNNNINTSYISDSYLTGRVQSPSGHLSASSMFGIPNKNEMSRLLEAFKKDHPNESFD